MNKGEKIKVYFKMDGRCYGLFNVIQMGKDGIVDLKITDYYSVMVIVSKNSNDEKGYLTEEEIDRSRFIYRAEMSYHNDGSFLHKIKDGIKPEYSNPYGQGERWTATNSIEDFQPILNIAIRRTEIYNKSSVHPILKNKEIAYICENDDLFEKNGTYLIILYIRNKKIPLNRYTRKELYSDIITELNKELDLCIFIQRHQYTKPKPYYSKGWKSMVTPYLNNSINFCNRESSKDEMKEKFGDAIFGSITNRFLMAMTDGEFINLSEDKLQLIDEVDILYKGHEGKMPVSKPVFIKLALNFLSNKLVEFNTLSSTIKQVLLKQWNKEVEARVQNEQNSHK